MSIPIIDFAAYSTPTALAPQIKEALTTVGFLFLENTGLEASAKEIFDISENFFKNESPTEREKSAIVNNKGYATFMQEKLDATEAEADKKEVFNIGIITRIEKPTKSLKPTQKLPVLLLERIDTIQRFQEQCFALCQLLLETFAILLGVDPKLFTSQHSFNRDSLSILRLLHYPAVLPTSNISPIRAGAHSDYGSLTLLFQKSEKSEGLQLLPPSEKLEGGIWRDVGVANGGVLVNGFSDELVAVGDALEFWSGAILKSTLHRVRLPTPIPSTGIPERFSIAFFNQPDSNAILKSIVQQDRISEIDRERMKRKGVTPGVTVTAGEHLIARLKATYK